MKNNRPFFKIWIFTISLLSVISISDFSYAEEKGSVPIKIDSYDIELHELETPIFRRSGRGEKQAFDKYYVVYLNGNFGEVRAQALEIFIGNYKISEYGGTPDGIYFKVYDETLLKRLEGKTFAFGYQGKKMPGLDKPFEPGKMGPFRRRKIQNK